MISIDRAEFFDGVRPIFGNKLSADQVAGMDAILDEWDRRKLMDLRWLADMLGTAKIETAHMMQPIKEYGGPAYFTKMYDITGARPDLARKMGNVRPGDGVKYCGRGYVQLTWAKNYAHMTDLLQAAGIAVDLEVNPDLALRDDIAAFVMFEGMIQGSFTKFRLDQFFNDTKTDFVGARRIINGLDRAQEIAAISTKFYSALRAAA